MGLVMKIHSRFYFTALLMLVMLFNTACGKKSDLTLPTPEEAPAQETSFKFKFSTPEYPLLSKLNSPCTPEHLLLSKLNSPCPPFHLPLPPFQETT